ncbi:MAG: hypothetical protein H7326_00190 [Bdellovibrionaceae bacterium]|nr:hypothetical protein [Pseudobdellovibrionaceae bacterium]
MNKNFFFARHPSNLAYFFELKEGLAPTEIKKKHNLNRATSKAALSKLESLGLSRQKTSGTIEIKFSGLRH